MNQIGAQDSLLPAMLSLGEALALADRYRSEGRLSDAELLCRRVLEAQANSAEAEHLLGLIAHQCGKLGDAIDHVRRATELVPHTALFHANLGEMLRMAGRPDLAVEAARRALAIEPSMATALSNLGVALYELKDYEEAAEAHRQAVVAAPDFAEAHSNLGNALHGLRRFDEAIAAYRRALQLKPDFADALANLGTTLHHSGSFDEGIATLRHALALAPHHANAHSGLGILLLMRGDFAEGWDEYEWRLRSSERTGPCFPERSWMGESLIGKHIYVQAEQGFGDSLQFARYLPLLAERAGRVTLRVHQQLVTLLRESLPGVTVLGDRGDPLPFDVDTALLSLPRLLKTRLETIPANIPYLRPTAETARRWRDRLASLPGFKVGVVWAGNPEHANDTRRSLDVSLLAPLLGMPNTSFVSLQVGERSAELKTLNRDKPSIRDMSPHFNDFNETAGAVAALDLVITVDTSVAHLAGGLGTPTWVLLPWVTDWRWMLEREDNPWYPTMRLRRQKRGQDWSEIISRIAADLRIIAAGDDHPLMPFKAEGERRGTRAAAIIAAEAAQAVLPATPTSAEKLSTGQALILAEQKRRHNFLGDAEELARQVVAEEPDNVEGIHLLGLIAHQSGHVSEAIAHMRRVVSLRPDIALYHANLGEMCRIAGHVEQAIAAGRHALEIDPDNPGAHSNLGIALFDQGKFEEALTHYQRAIALQPQFAEAHSNHGNALQRLKRFAEAEPSYRRAVELRPGFADAWNNLGTCLREMGRLTEADEAYRKALGLQPNNPDFLDSLALALKDLKRHEEAVETMRRALVIDEARDAFHTHYATILIELGKFDEAESALRSAFAINPSNHDTVNQMGRVAFERGDLEASLSHYRRALSLKPDLADAYNNMGNTLKELGRLQEAREAYLEAARLEPDITGTYVNLADSTTFAASDPHIATMEALAEKTDGLSTTDRMQLGFALGKVYADLKDHRRSFAHLREANALKRAMVSYDEKEALGFFDRIEAVFTPAFIRDKAGVGESSSRPIFVVGMPRSGTTLVEQILASHPAVHGAGELAAFDKAVQSIHCSGNTQIQFPEFVVAANASALRQIGLSYLAELKQIVPDSERVTDKMPSNYYYAGLIHLTLPRAKIIHCVRDPVDTCVSCFSKLFSGAQVHTYDLAELGRYYRRYERLMMHWRSVLPKGRILDVRYEDVVADLERQARRILAYCALPWNDRCLAFHRTERPVRTASATQVRRPIYNTAVGRWRAYADDLGPLLDALGIDAKAESPAAGKPNIQ